MYAPLESELNVHICKQGGAGVVVYYRKEGRALGEVTKYLVYNMRKRQLGGDSAAEYFNCTRNVAGVIDTRFQVTSNFMHVGDDKMSCQATMPDALHWLGITRIHK
jgi:GTP cyclohydrolase II